MTTLQDLQFPIDRAIFGELLLCLPAGWASARLVASEQRGQEGGHTTMAVHIDALGQPGIALVSNDLQARIRELFLLNQRHGSGLTGMVYTKSVGTLCDVVILR